ncbi:hypothetical protein CEXT_335761 [Caerostris extrusa]|uniref:Uncharacterized protein n=1 Tax=Caerostris extrusa TaxID=172846 RepID=A0AAV4QXY9_CAEEX|nr:hypothetical protein CEXT_335761 [Caerostris extrusa]
MNTSEICEVCQCNDDSIYACTDGAQMFSQKFITVTSTIAFITLLSLAIKSLCSDRNRLKHRERFGCQKEGMDTDASEPLIDAELGTIRDQIPAQLVKIKDRLKKLQHKIVLIVSYF